LYGLPPFWKLEANLQTNNGEDVTAQPKGLLGQNRPCAHVCVQGARESNFSPIFGKARGAKPA